MTAKKARVIVLRKHPFRESDLIVHALNCDGHSLHFVARGALRSRKRFGGGVLEPTHYIEVDYDEKNRSADSQLHLLREAQLLEDFEGIRHDYDRLQSALQILNWVARVSRDSDSEGKELFDLLGHALRAHESSPQLGLLAVHFQVKLLCLLGVLPQNAEFALFLSKTIAKHCEIELPPARLMELRNQTESRLERYLQGLNN